MDKETKHPYLSWDEQIQHLETNKKLIIPDKKFAKLALQTFSYYSIVNGYKDLFLLQKNTSSTDEQFIDGTTFDMLYQVHWIDLTLNNLILKYVLTVEKNLKSVLADRVANSFSIYEKRYLDAKCYSDNQKWKLSSLKKEIEKIQESDESVKHYKETENNVPPWIYTNALTLGTTINWYSILQLPHKNLIINEFLGNIPMNDENKRDLFKRILKQIHQFRNSAAHGNRLFHFKVTEDAKQHISFIKKLDLIPYFTDKRNNIVGTDNLYTVLFSILWIINDPYVSLNFLNDLYNFLNQYSLKSFDFVGKNIYDLLELDTNFFNRLTNFYDHKFKKNLSEKLILN